MNSERVVRELASALPEAFAGLDIEDEFCDDSDGTWLPYIALPIARDWIEENALTIGRDRRSASVRGGGEEPLTRFLGYVEWLAALHDDEARNLLLLELFDDAEWAESVGGLMGPETRSLLQGVGILRWRAPRDA